MDLAVTQSTLRLKCPLSACVRTGAIKDADYGHIPEELNFWMLCLHACDTLIFVSSEGVAVFLRPALRLGML